MTTIRVGTRLAGLCGGYFGRDSYPNKRVEGVGADWVVARELDTDLVVFANVAPELLEGWVQ